MYISINHSEAYKYQVIDKNTGIRIPGIQEADDETGEFTCFLIDSFINEILCDIKGKPILFQFKGNIEIRKDR
jgi:hypothetical protein